MGINLEEVRIKIWLDVYLLMLQYDDTIPPMDAKDALEAFDELFGKKEKKDG